VDGVRPGWTESSPGGQSPGRSTEAEGRSQEPMTMMSKCTPRPSRSETSPRPFGRGFAEGQPGTALHPEPCKRRAGRMRTKRQWHRGPFHIRLLHHLSLASPSFATMMAMCCLRPYWQCRTNGLLLPCGSLSGTLVVLSRKGYIERSTQCVDCILGAACPVRRTERRGARRCAGARRNRPGARAAA